MPTVIRFGHHHQNHEHVISKVNNEKHFPEFKERCAICDFEFSVFSSDEINTALPKEQHSDRYCINYSSFIYSKHSVHSFLLRAPPINIHA
jgi:uncharacterized protein with PIN domain